MKIKSFECPKSIKNHEKKKILGTTDTWSTSRLSHQHSEPAYHNVDSHWPRNVREQYCRRCNSNSRIFVALLEAKSHITRDP